MAALHVPDPRLLALAALVVAAILMARLAPSERAPLRLAALLLPPCLFGVVFGSGSLLLIALVVVAFAVGQGAEPRSRRALGIGVAVYVGLILGAAGAWSALGPGLGLSNLRLYAGAVPGTRDFFSLSLALAVSLVAARAARRADGEPRVLLAYAAAFLMSALWLAPVASPDDVAAPIALLALAATMGPRERFDSPGRAL